MIQLIITMRIYNYIRYIQLDICFKIIFRFLKFMFNDIFNYIQCMDICFKKIVNVHSFADYIDYILYY